MTKDFFVLSSELEFKLDLLPRDDSTEDEDANVRYKYSSSSPRRRRLRYSHKTSHEGVTASLCSSSPGKKSRH